MGTEQDVEVQENSEGDEEGDSRTAQRARFDPAMTDHGPDRVSARCFSFLTAIIIACPQPSTIYSDFSPCGHIVWAWSCFLFAVV